MKKTKTKVPTTISSVAELGKAWRQYKSNLFDEYQIVIADHLVRSKAHREKFPNSFFLTSLPDRQKPSFEGFMDWIVNNADD